MALARYIAYGDVTWDAWCDGQYPGDADAELNAKCKSPGTFAPWTSLGRSLRGLPPGEDTLSQLLGSIVGKGAASQPQPAGAGSQIPTYLALAVVAGAAFLLLK